METVIAIAIGGALGSLGRYGISVGISKLTILDFPFGTLAANLLGCLLIGFLWGYFDRVYISHEFRVFLFTGFLGGLTTFSTFAREAEQFFRTGEPWHAIIYILVSNIAGIAMVGLGFFLCYRLLK